MVLFQSCTCKGTFFGKLFLTAFRGQKELKQIITQNRVLHALHHLSSLCEPTPPPTEFFCVD